MLETVNSRIKILFEFLNMSQVEFAEKINISGQTLSNVLKGTFAPSYMVIENIAQAFPELSLDWLIRGNGAMWKNEESKKTATRPSADLFSSPRLAGSGESLAEFLSDKSGPQGIKPVVLELFGEDEVFRKIMTNIYPLMLEEIKSRYSGDINTGSSRVKLMAVEAAYFASKVIKNRWKLFLEVASVID